MLRWHNLYRNLTIYVREKRTFTNEPQFLWWTLVGDVLPAWMPQGYDRAPFVNGLVVSCQMLAKRECEINVLLSLWLGREASRANPETMTIQMAFHFGRSRSCIVTGPWYVLVPLPGTSFRISIGPDTSCPWTRYHTSRDQECSRNFKDAVKWNQTTRRRPLWPSSRLSISPFRASSDRPHRADEIRQNQNAGFSNLLIALIAYDTDSQW